MAISNSLDRVGKAMAPISFSEALAAKVDAVPGAAELAAAHEVDGLAHDEILPLDAVDAFPQRGSDDLRLPPPPGVYVPGGAMSRALRDAVDVFASSVGQGVNANPEALAAETRMMALVRGIQDLQREIETRRDAGQAA